MRLGYEFDPIKKKLCQCRLRLGSACSADRWVQITRREKAVKTSRFSPLLPIIAFG